MNKVLKYLFLIALFISVVALPTDIEAKTIQEFENEVAKYTSQLQEKKNKLAKNDEEVAQIRKKISEIENQIDIAEKEIKKLQEEIDASNIKIKEKDAESKKLMKYFQVVINDNAYLEYIFGAKDVKDMIYRMAVVEQLTEYNNQVMKELEALIKENNQKQSELKNKQTELTKLKADLQDQKERINADSNAIRETMPSLEEQIKSAKANVSYYKSLGCGSTEDIQSCQFRVEQSRGGSGGSVPSANGFYRPISYGYITQYYRGSAHMGIDMSSSNKSIEVYPIATGTVFKIYYDNCSRNNCSYGCNGRAKVVKIRHNVNGRYIYSTYAHLSSFGNISEGMVVSPYTMIGNMGTSGCSTGPHLHLEVTTCDWNAGGGCTWGVYQSSTINPSSYVAFPSSWNNR